ncbi:unnamed protein product [Peniophora sp. CBMAI 1063]|nr:unnamed protein product [Peniophora sp. CBMAI 1063]
MLGLPDPLKPGSSFFTSSRDGGEVHLAFALSLDGFNPRGRREGGKKCSSTEISLVCLNLPPNIRFKDENMILIGIVPGPKEPSLEQINFVLRPLVDDLLELWTTGVFLSQTPEVPRGRRVRAALVPLVADMPAAQQAGGFAGFRSKHFCTICHLHKRDINNLDKSTWAPRDNASHRQTAEQWRSLETWKERDDLYKVTGVRYSELLRLPYWDAILWNVGEVMHTGHHNVGGHHCKSFLGMSLEFADGDGTLPEPVRNGADPHLVDNAWSHVRWSPKEELQKLSKIILEALVSRAAIRCKTHTKDGMSEALHRFRVAKGWFDQNGHLVEPSRGTAQSEQVPRPVDDLQLMDRAATSADVDVMLTYFRYAPSIKELKLFTAQKLKVLLLNVVPGALVDTSKRGLIWSYTKAQCLKALASERVKQKIVDEDGAVRDQDEELMNEARRTMEAKKKTVILGSERLRLVHEDIGATIVPAWMGHISRIFGTPSAGTTHANDLFWFCVVYLPITLGRLWGHYPVHTRERQILDCTMWLALTLELTASDVLNLEAVRDAALAYREYVHALRHLFPDIPLYPCHHDMFHILDLLPYFGPTANWNAYAYERSIGLMQRVPTNNRPSEMETTIFTATCQRRRLRTVIDALDAGELDTSGMDEPTLSSQLEKLREVYAETPERRRRGTLYTDVLSPVGELGLRDFAAQIVGKKRSPAPDHWNIELDRIHNTANNPWRTTRSVVYLNEVKIRGAIYGTSHPNYYVAIPDPDPKAQAGEGWRAARIVKLFITPATQSNEVARGFAVVRGFHTLSADDEVKDNYRRYRRGGRLFYRTEDEAEKIIGIDDLLGNCTRIDLESMGTSRPVFQAKALFVGKAASSPSVAVPSSNDVNATSTTTDF